MKVINLTAHRNTQQRRRERETTKDMLCTAKDHAAHKNIAGYVLVSWNAQHDAEIDFNTGTSKLTGSALPDFVRGAIQRKLSMMDNEI